MTNFFLFWKYEEIYFVTKQNEKLSTRSYCIRYKTKNSSSSSSNEISNMHGIVRNAFWLFICTRISDTCNRKPQWGSVQLLIETCYGVFERADMKIFPCIFRLQLPWCSCKLMTLGKPLIFLTQSCIWIECLNCCSPYYQCLPFGIAFNGRFE